MLETFTPINIFCSYAHEDEASLRKVEKHLSPLKRQGLISLWHDRLISPGSDWATTIDIHLETASIILLFISADFLASDYCYGIEMQRQGFWPLLQTAHLEWDIRRSPCSSEERESHSWPMHNAVAESLKAYPGRLNRHALFLRIQENSCSIKNKQGVKGSVAGQKPPFLAVTISEQFRPISYTFLQYSVF